MGNGAQGRFFPVANQGVALPEFGEGKNRIGAFSIALDAARENKKFEIGGSLLWCVNATDNNANVNIAFQDEYTGQIPYRNGTFVRVGRFSRLFLTHTAQSGKTMDFVYVNELGSIFEVENPGAVFQSVNAEVTNFANNGLTTTADVTAVGSATTQILAANSDRRAVHLTNLTAATLRFGDSNAGASRGVAVGAGLALTLHTTAAIYAYNPGSSAAVAILEETYT